MIKCKIPLTHSHKCEIYFNSPSLKIKRIEDLDTLANSMNSPAIVIEPEFLNHMSIIKQVANSLYKVVVAIDINGETFGANKILQTYEFAQADGFEIGLGIGKNIREIRNEIKAINTFLIQSNIEFDTRWVINIANGEKFIYNAIEAIKAEKPKNSIITIKGNDKSTYDVVKSCRKQMGIIKAEMKICSKLHDKLLNNDSNLKYLIPINDLM